MTNDSFRKLLPISGIISALILAASIFATPSAPQVSATNHAEVVAFYGDHQTGLFIASIGGLLAMFFFVPLLIELRATLRSGEAGESIYSSLALAGGIALIAGTGLMSFTIAAASGAAEAKLGAQSILTAAVATDYSWMPWVLGMAILQWAVGLGALRTATLPKALGWVSILLGILCLSGPGGFAVFIVAPLWILGVSVVLLRGRRSTAPHPLAEPNPAAA